MALSQDLDTAASPDAQITINQGSRSAPPAFSMPASPAITSQSPEMPGAVVEDSVRRRVNWRSVAKIALIVGAVAVLGILSYSIISTWIAGSLAGSTGALASIISTAGTVATSLAHYAVAGINAAFFGVAWVWGAVAKTLGIGAGAAHVASHGAAVTISQGTANTIGAAFGWVGGGLAVAATAPFALAGIKSTALMETVHHQTVAPAPLNLEQTTPGLLGSKKHAMNQQLQPDHSTHQASSTDLGDLPDIPEEINASQSASRTIKMTHQAAHHAQEAENRRATNALSRSAQASETWLERASPRRERSSANPRADEFASQIQQDRAELNTILGKN